MNLDYQGITIFYTIKGRGDSIVLLHGFLENSSMWNAFLPELTKTNQVICIDLLGHGQTRSLGYIHTMEQMASAVKAVLNHLNITKTFFVGHSMGGYVALAFAENNPNYTKGLCLINSTAKEDSIERQTNRNRAILAVKDNHKTFIRLAINNLFRPKNRTRFSNEIKQITKEALKTSLQGIIAALEGMKIRPNRENILNHKSFKNMMIISKNDPVLNYNSLIEQIKNPEITVIVLPDGHMSHIENKNELLKTILEFSKSNSVL